MQPLSRERALAFWQRVADGVVRQERALLVAEDEAGIVGTVQLVSICRKPAASRRSGQDAGAPPWASPWAGEALMRAAEQLGRDSGKSLLVLDTVTGGDAERLMRDWLAKERRDPEPCAMAAGGLCDTTLSGRCSPPLRLAPLRTVRPHGGSRNPLPPCPDCAGSQSSDNPPRRFACSRKQDQ